MSLIDVVGSGSKGLSGGCKLIVLDMEIVSVESPDGEETIHYIPDEKMTDETIEKTVGLMCQYLRRGNKR